MVVYCTWQGVLHVILTWLSCVAQARYDDEPSADGASAPSRFAKVIMLMGW